MATGGAAHRIPKRTFYRIVEISYRDGIGARRLERLLGYSYTHIRVAARRMGLPRLPRHDHTARPSLELLGLLATVEHFVLSRRL
jgi:hypothetical protein